MTESCGRSNLTGLDTWTSVQHSRGYPTVVASHLAIADVAWLLREVAERYESGLVHLATDLASADYEVLVSAVELSAVLPVLRRCVEELERVGGIVVSAFPT